MHTTPSIELSESVAQSALTDFTVMEINENTFRKLNISCNQVDFQKERIV